MRMNDLSNWTEVTKGLYRYVIGANCCYEIHILNWGYKTDILEANANLYIVGEWHRVDIGDYFAREYILKEKPVFECLKAALADDEENNIYD